MHRPICSLVVAAAALAVASGVTAAPAVQLTGTRRATDPSDGSLEQLTFGAGGSLFSATTPHAPAGASRREVWTRARP